MTWRFSDGTTAELGGTIEGASLFAQELRAELAHGDTLIPEGALPCGGILLDVNNPAHFDRWLRGEMAKPYRRDARLTLTEAPTDFDPLPEPESDDDESDTDDDGEPRVY